MMKGEYPRPFEQFELSPLCDDAGIEFEAKGRMTISGSDNEKTHFW